MLHNTRKRTQALISLSIHEDLLGLRMLWGKFAYVAQLKKKDRGPDEPEHSCRLAGPLLSAYRNNGYCNICR